MTDCWVPQPARLKFRLGEWRFGSVEFPSLVHNAHFTRLMDSCAEPALPFERFPRGLRAVKIPSLPVRQQQRRLTLTRRTIRYVPSQYQRYYIDLQGSFDDYLGKFSSKSRSTLRRKVRKFQDFCGGQISWREFRRPEDMAAFHCQARAVASKTYQEKLFQAALPADDKFVQETAELAGRGAIRGYVLFHGERPIAYLYCPIQDETLLYQYVGYDPEYHQWSPGMVLLFLVLEKLFADGGLRFFDFTEGEGAHKDFFANRSALCADVYYFRASLRHLVLVGLHSGLDFFSRTVVKGLDRLGLKGRIKKYLRFGR
jgi:CelD/BcsL family acetyltransferase involved in cellulose biosynthesis